MWKPILFLQIGNKDAETYLYQSSKFKSTEIF